MILRNEEIITAMPAAIAKYIINTSLYDNPIPIPIIRMIMPTISCVPEPFFITSARPGLDDSLYIFSTDY
jgi:hypothetical protein